MNPRMTKTETSTPMLSREKQLNGHHASKQASVQRFHNDDKIADPVLLDNPAEREINYCDDSLVVPHHPSPGHRSLCSDFSNNAVAKGSGAAEAQENSNVATIDEEDKEMEGDEEGDNDEADEDGDEADKMLMRMKKKM